MNPENIKAKQIEAAEFFENLAKKFRSGEIIPIWIRCNCTDIEGEPEDGWGTSLPGPTSLYIEFEKAGSDE